MNMAETKSLMVRNKKNIRAHEEDYIAGFCFLICWLGIGLDIGNTLNIHTRCHATFRRTNMHLPMFLSILECVESGRKGISPLQTLAGKEKAGWAGRMPKAAAHFTRRVPGSMDQAGFDASRMKNLLLLAPHFGLGEVQWADFLVAVTYDEISRRPSALDLTSSMVWKRLGVSQSRPQEAWLTAREPARLDHVDHEVDLAKSSSPPAGSQC
jgi:hypothetical protein